MKPSNLYLCFWCYSLFIFVCPEAFNLNIRDYRVRLRLLEFDRENKLVQVVSSQDSDIIYGEGIAFGNSVVLECRSTLGPVAYEYKGDGAPKYITNTNVTRNLNGQYFWTFLRFNIPKAEDTGNYSCKSTNNPQIITNSVFFYVPDSSQNIFVPNQGVNRLEFSRSEGTVRLPCGVVHPDAIVSLERISYDREYRSMSFGKVTFDPKRGFHLPMSIVTPDSSIIYMCRAKLNGRIQESMFKLVSEEDLDGYTISTEKPTRNSGGLISLCTKSTCGVNAECIVIDYNPYCVCLENYSGDPKNGCYKINDKSEQLIVRDPCIPNPCGKYSQCVAVNHHPICSCLEDHFGMPPLCKPKKNIKCYENTDCEWEEYCNHDTQVCENVCNGTMQFCGPNTKCFVTNHLPVCECLKGFSGPYSTRGSIGCRSTLVSDQHITCGQNLCGKNAECKIHPLFSGPQCRCIKGFIGNPMLKCTRIHESYTQTQNCTTNPLELQKDLCSSLTTCGINARCRLRNGNRKQCFCLPSFEGDPYVQCTSIASEQVIDLKVCNVCGPNSICEIKRGKISCECTLRTTGVPPNCKFQRNNICRDDFDCSNDKVCQKNICLSPCSFSCAEMAICQVTKHVAKCKCPKDFEGDARFECKKSDENKKKEMNVNSHPCRINCGPNTVCRAVDYDEIREFRKSLREDTHFFDLLKANRNLRSGIFSECFCRKGFDGNPYSVAGCSIVNDEDSEFPVTIVMESDPCKPNTPCGPWSDCKGYNGRAFCSCTSNAAGQPPKCKLRCQADKDCLFNETCVDGFCDDP